MFSKNVGSDGHVLNERSTISIPLKGENSIITFLYHQKG